MKKDYLKGVGDTFDLVVIGGYYGKGKRTSVYGAFLLACYDSDSEKFQAVCKLGTGFSEEALKSNMETLKELEMTNCRSDIDGGGAKPDVWFEPKIVWEILAADLSLSPVYTAARGIVRILFTRHLSSILPPSTVPRCPSLITHLHVHSTFIIIRSTIGECRCGFLDSYEFVMIKTLTMLQHQNRWVKCCPRNVNRCDTLRKMCEPSLTLDRSKLQVAEMYERQSLATSKAAAKAKSGAEDNFW